MNAAAELRDHYFAALDRVRRHRDQPGWRLRQREEAFGRFLSTGLPTIRHEDWKYTDVSALNRTPFDAVPGQRPGVPLEKLSGSALGRFPAHRTVFMNGRFAATRSRRLPLPEGAQITGLREALTTYPDLLEPYLGRLPEPGHPGFYALNTALSEDGAFIYLPKGVVIPEPVHLLFVTAAGEHAPMTHPRNLVVAEEGSRVTIIEHYVSAHGERYFTNAVTEIYAGPGATVEYLGFQDEAAGAFHVANLGASLGAGATFGADALAFGARLARTNIRSQLSGDGARCQLNGLFVAGGRQHMDFHALIDHRSPGGTSRAHFRGILDGRARGVFDGRIVVQPDAQRSDARLTSRNLLLSRDAEADAKPQLEIHADDVKCSHGTTVGPLDENMVFYLRSRGMEETAARSLLTYAFAADVLQRLRLQAVRPALAARLLNSLPAGERIKEFYDEYAA